MSNGKTVSDKDKLKLSGKKLSDKDKKSMKSRITAINRGVASSKVIANEIKAAAAGAGISKDIINKAYNLAFKMQGGSGGRTVSNKDFMAALKKMKKLRQAKQTEKKGKPHLKHGGKDKNLFGLDIEKLKKGTFKFPKGFLTGKKGKPHLKHGGKAKKKYGVVGKPTLKKGGKV